MYKTLEEFLKDEEDESVSINELIDTIGQNNAKVIKYSDLASYASLEALFSSVPNIVIYFPIETETQGHFVAMLHYPEMNLVNYFCPYGLSVEGDIQQSRVLRHANPATRLLLPRMVDDFKARGGKFTESLIPIQEMSDAVATCGKHCFFRIMFREIVEPDAYARFLNYHNLTPDEIVTLAFV